MCPAVNGATVHHWQAIAAWGTKYATETGSTGRGLDRDLSGVCDKSALYASVSELLQCSYAALYLLVRNVKGAVEVNQGSLHPCPAAIVFALFRRAPCSL